MLPSFREYRAQRIQEDDPDEVCLCGHQKSDHANVVFTALGVKARAAHHGHCEHEPTNFFEDECDCPMFTWVGYGRDWEQRVKDEYERMKSTHDALDTPFPGECES